MSVPLAFLPEYHDVTVANFSEVAGHLELLGAQGVPCWSLMVVPDVAGAGPGQVAAFAEQLRCWRNAGHSLCVHGMRHRALAGLARSCQGRLALRLTGNEAEFAGLGFTDSEALLQEALRAWDALQVGPAEGFVPPTWHDNPYLFAQCQQAGFVHYGARTWVWNADRGWQKSISWSFAGLPEWSLPGVRAFAKVAARLLPGLPRLVLHPCDFAPGRVDATLRVLRSFVRSGSSRECQKHR